MTQQSVLPPEVQKVLAEAEQEATRAEITSPQPTTYELDGGLLDIDGQWHTTFTVRELTGRDEEALGRVTSPGQFMIELIQRGLVSVGPHKGTDVVDGVTSGDWETILVAIRSVTFGPELSTPLRCSHCRDEYEVDVDLIKDLPRVRLNSSKDLSFTVTGRHNNEYAINLPTGATQRALLKAMNETVAEQNTLLLMDCIVSVDGRQVLGKDAVLNIPMADRRKILAEIGQRKPGPRLGEVKTLCPSCGGENVLSLSIAALFQ